MPWFTGKLGETLRCYYWKFPAVSPLPSYESHLSCQVTLPSSSSLGSSLCGKDCWNLPTVLLLLLVVGLLPTHTISSPKCHVGEAACRSVIGMILTDNQQSHPGSCYAALDVPYWKADRTLLYLSQCKATEHFLRPTESFLFLVAGTYLVPNK